MSAEYLLWFLSPLGSYRVLACPAPVNAAGPAMTLVRKFVNLWDLFPSLGSTPWAITKVTVVRGILVVNVRPHYICPRGFQFFLPGFQARRSWGNHKFNSRNSIFKTKSLTVIYHGPNWTLRLVFVTARGEKRIFQATLG